MSSVAQTASQMPALVASARTVGGKSAVRRLRAQGHVPAVAYGKGLAATHLSVSPKAVLAILKSEHGQNSVIQLGVHADGGSAQGDSAEGSRAPAGAGSPGGAGQSLIVMIKEYSYHPVNRNLEHVDFVEVKLDQPVDVEIPLVATGKAAGVVLGGVLRQVYRTLPVRCLPDRIPVKIEVDVTNLKLNEHIATKDLSLAEGVTVRLAPDQTVIAVVAPEKDRTEEAAPGAPAAAAAAPAKDAKAAAPAKDAKKK